MSKKKINFLASRTRKNLLQISRQELDETQAMEIASCLAILNDIRRTTGVIAHTTVPLIERKNSVCADFITEGKKELLEYHLKAGNQLERLEGVLKEGTRKLARKIKKSKKSKKKKSNDDGLDLHSRQQAIKRLLRKRPESQKAHHMHSAMIDAIRQITIYTTTIAEQILASEAVNKQN
jgi:Na+/phosphate symporter